MISDDDEQQIYNKKNLIYILGAQFKIVPSKNGMSLNVYEIYNQPQLHLQRKRAQS